MRAGTSGLWVGGGISLMAATPALAEAGSITPEAVASHEQAAPAAGGLAIEAMQQSVDNPNSEEYWEALGFGECTKVQGPGGETYFLGEAPDGTKWTILILKAGNENSTEDPQVEYHDPEENTSYGPIIGDNGEPKVLSYIMECYLKDETTTTTTVHKTTTTVGSTTTTTTELVTTTTEGTTTTVESSTTTTLPDGTSTSIGETTTTLPDGTTTTTPNVIVTTSSTAPNQSTTTTQPKIVTTTTKPALPVTGLSERGRDTAVTTALILVGAGAALTGLAGFSRRRVQ